MKTLLLLASLSAVPTRGEGFSLLALSSLFFNLDSTSKMAAEVGAPPIFCPTPGLLARRAPADIELRLDALRPPPSPLTSMLRTAEDFDRRSSSGRRQCQRALRQWLSTNSIWAYADLKGRIENTISLFEEARLRLRDKGIRLHRELDLGLASCITRIEARGLYYPETPNLGNICDGRCQFVEGHEYEYRTDNCRQSGRPKRVAQGLGQIIAPTFAGYADRVGFENFGSLGLRPDIQIEMKLLQLNDNLFIDYDSQNGFVKNFIDKFSIGERCFGQDADQWEMAVALYDQQGCSGYLKKIHSCREICFAEGRSRRQQIDCLASTDERF